MYFGSQPFLSRVGYSDHIAEVLRIVNLKRSNTPATQKNVGCVTGSRRTWPTTSRGMRDNSLVHLVYSGDVLGPTETSRPA